MISAIAALKSSNDNGVFNGTNNDLPSSAQKVIVQLKATADTPILKQNKFKIPGTDIFAKVIEFLWRQIHRETVFVYMSSAFSPNPDELVIDLLNNFGVDGKLLVNYACSMAWANCHSGI